MVISVGKIAPAFIVHDSFAPLVHLYDGFLLDQFGVLHDGSESLPGARECVERLHSEKKKLVILSNTSSPAETALKRLPKFGFDAGMFDGGAVTSGEEASKYISEMYGQQRVDEKNKALWITWAESEKQQPIDFLSKCGDIEIATSVDEADFILLHGSEVWRRHGDGGEHSDDSVTDLGFLFDGELSVIDPLLEKCIQKGLPMVCANPDFIVAFPGGKIGNMPGKVAERFENMGGKCKSFGKPHARHFEACRRQLGLAKDRVAHVGDSLAHDVHGANQAGIDSVFVVGGIHARDLGINPGETPSTQALRHLFEEKGVWPTHVVNMFKL